MVVGVIERFRRWKRRTVRIDLPVEPNTISALSVVASFGVWIAPVPAIAFVLLLDTLDGAVARARKKTENGNGKITDKACDRYSEFVIFGHYATGNPLLAVLPAINTAMVLLTAKGRTNEYALTFPLRQGLLLYLVLQHLGIRVWA